MCASVCVCVCVQVCVCVFNSVHARTARAHSSIQPLDSSISSCSYQVRGNGKLEELSALLSVPASLFPRRHFQYVYSEVI